MNEKYISEIPKQHINKQGVILFGSGPSLDKLDLDQLNKQNKYDTCTLSDAIKVLKNPTFAINYHFSGLQRIAGYIENPKYMIMHSSVVSYEICRRKMRKQTINYKLYENYQKKLDSLNNLYYFKCRNKIYKELSLIVSKEYFTTYEENELFHSFGSVVGAIHFLINYMKYKIIYYIGFDGGMNYSKLTFHGRKETKRKCASRSYKDGWNEIEKIINWFPEIKFIPLKEFFK